MQKQSTIKITLDSFTKLLTVLLGSINLFLAALYLGYDLGLASGVGFEIAHESGYRVLARQSAYIMFLLIGHLAARYWSDSFGSKVVGFVFLCLGIFPYHSVFLQKRLFSESDIQMGLMPQSTIVEGIGFVVFVILLAIAGFSVFQSAPRRVGKRK